MKYIYSDKFPDDVTFFTAGKRYEIIETINHWPNSKHYQAFVIGDDGDEHGPINIGWPCAYLNDGLWSIEDGETPS